MEFDKEMVKGSTAPIVLKLLQEREMYGYEIVKVVNERTGGRFQWKEGTLYPCLHRLEAGRMLASRWHDAPTGRKRKYYRITRKGLAELERRTAEWREFSTAVTAVLMGSTA
jgi:DNA-binding PadR family transcriptional regulator